MPCVKCNQSEIYIPPRERKRRDGITIPDCDFTKEQVEAWKVKLICISNNNLFQQAGTTKAQMNSFLGVVNSVVIYNNNPCAYTATLQKILDLIITIVSLEICQ